jgi:multidrug efflux system membrane fusion protein
MRTFIGWILLICCAAAGCRRGSVEAAPRAPTPVKVRVVAEPAARGATRYSGVVDPAAKVDVAFKVGGYVRQVAEAKGQGRKLQEGDWVKKGTVLAVIDEADYRQRVAAARAALAEAAASAKQAELDFGRARRLLASSAISQAEFDNAQSKVEVAAARVDSARSQIGQAEIALADCTLHAPFDGVVVKRSVEVGTLAGTGAPAFTVADTRTVKVVFGAPDMLLDRLRIGDKLNVRVESLGKDLAADITRISPSADTKSRTFDIEASLDNRDDQLKIGMVASIAIPAGALAAPRLSLPLAAVVRAPGDPRGFAVFVVDRDDVARVREVKLGAVAGSSVLVLAGLEPGERVIDRGTPFVSDGEPVRVVR